MRHGHLQMSNPLTTVSLQIPFDQIGAKHVRPAVDELLQQCQLRVDAIKSGHSTYDGTLGALEAATEVLEFAMGVVDHLESVATTDELRDVYNKARPKVSAFFSSLSMDEELYNAIKRFSQTDEAKKLGPTKTRFLKKSLDDFRRSGVELPPEQKEELAAVDVKLTELTTTFSQNTLDETNAFELVITDESQLAGLPTSAIDAAKANASQKGVDGWRFTLHAPSLTPLLTYLDDRSIRHKVWTAYNTRATSGSKDNRDVLLQILNLRSKRAALLGYEDFSDLVLEDRMAKNGSAANEFVVGLYQKTLATFERENSELQAFRKSIEGDSAPKLETWDIGYYAEKQRKALFDFDEEELRPYFELESLLGGLFSIVQSLYDIRIVEWQTPVWHEDVRSYAIQDAEGTMLAAFYADFFPREDKRGGAWMNHFITGTPTPGGGRSPHLGLICTNANPPIGDKPALLTHRDVETLFHEFGHLLHHCLTTVDVRSLAGVNVAWDFVELPSQIMENWCWEREALDRFAKHYETQEPIPDTLFTKMLRARTYRAANAQMRQLGFSAMDLSLHREFNAARDGDVMHYARDILQRYASTSLPTTYGMVAAFGHLFSSPTGYAAGYYSYKWAEVLDADAFGRFKSEGIVNPIVGQEFREKILSKGDSEDPAQLYRAFMGRDPKIDALLERAGLAT